MRLDYFFYDRLNNHDVTLHVEPSQNFKGEVGSHYTEVCHNPDHAGRTDCEYDYSYDFTDSTRALLGRCKSWYSLEAVAINGKVH